MMTVLPVCVQSKALRERWLLDGAPSAGPEQDSVKRQLEQDEAKTRSLEETINRSDQKLEGVGSQSDVKLMSFSENSTS